MLWRPEDLLLNGRRRYGLRALALFVVIALTLLPMVVSAPVWAADPKARPDLYEMFDIEGVGAQIIVAVDTSLSMKGDFKEVWHALDGFSRELGPRDHLTIIVFDNDAREVYSGPANRTAAVRKALPSAPDPNGQKTNMGEAVDLVLKELEGEREKLPVVMFLTDGREDPPPESEFAVRPSEAWRNLKDRAANQPNSKNAYVHGIGLNQNTDIERLRRIWPQARPISITPSELGLHFKSLKERIRRERLRHEVQRELKRGRVTVRIEETNWGALRAGTTGKQEMVVTSHYKKLPVEVDLAGLSWRGFQPISAELSAGAAAADGGAGIEPPVLKVKTGKFTLRPGQSRTVPISTRVSGEGGQVELRKEQQFRGRLHVALSAVAPVGPKISELGIEPRIKVTGNESQILFRRSTGISLYVFLALGLAAMASLFAIGRYAVTPAGQLVYRRVFAPPLFGRLAFAAAPGGTKLPRPVSLDGLGRKATIGTSGRIELQGENIEPIHAEIFSAWEEGEARLMIRPREGTVRVARSSASTPVIIGEETEMRPGGVIQIGEYKMQWS